MASFLNYSAKINIVSSLVSIPFIICGVWLRFQDCRPHLLDTSLMVLGSLMLVVSIIGVYAQYKHLIWLGFLHYAVMVVLMVLLGFGIVYFGFRMEYQGGGETKSGRGYREYQLESFDDWYQKMVISGWGEIKDCLVANKVCDSLSKQIGLSPSHFNRKHLSPIQSGCCKPPQECGFRYKSPTVWDKISRSSSKNTDCISWESTALCFDCRSCKAAVLESTKPKWRKISVPITVFFVLQFVLLLASFFFFLFFFY